MTVQTTIAFAAFLLEDNHLFTLYEGTYNLANNFGSFNGRSAYCNSTVGINKKHFVEVDSIAFFNCFAEIVNEQFLVFSRLELLSLDFYNCVH